ncbi:hypothetical protein [Agitococcus lubricus]|uniref:Uncharacterized protein n=1 Tax=Agitococcus lubricus TaxID=1077255 RepID=A0A2T5J2R3_9GAMM|nr:hypothetical protein [Agitococcus lubricus]PTQ90702.1 hypothetical protein C8N29_102102 [Agitococcus lubricus]
MTWSRLCANLSFWLALPAASYGLHHYAGLEWLIAIPIAIAIAGSCASTVALLLSRFN